jgi:DNA-damage-inducible protein J
MDMGKTGYITARVEPKLKASAGRVLTKIGVSTSDAITMFLRQVVLRRGMPFDVRVPNAETKRAIEELENPTRRAKLKKRSTTEEMFADILGKKPNQAKKRV